MLVIEQQLSYIGKRDENQDAYLVKSFDNGDILLAVADGMGGGVMGAELSAKTMELLSVEFASSKEYPLGILEKLTLSINGTLQEMLAGEKGGTTLCVVYYVQSKSKIYYLNVGDSRLSVCSEGVLKSITLDQNSYQAKRLKQDYAEEEDMQKVHKILGITTHADLEALFSDSTWHALGEYDLMVNDRLLLSTDGFHDVLEEGHSCDVIGSGFVQTLADVKASSQDNITLIIAKEI